MAFDFKKLQKLLAQYKVYNAWQYVESLNEYLTYMAASYKLAEKVYENRVSSLSERSQSLLQKAITTGTVNVTDEDLDCTRITVAGLEIDDELYLKKSTLEFFHYAKISIDILFQIINAYF